MYNHRHHRPQHRPNNPLFRPRFPIFRQQFPQFPQFPRFHHYHPHHAFAFGNFWHAEDPSIQHEEQQLEQEETSDAGLAPVFNEGEEEHHSQEHQGREHKADGVGEDASLVQGQGQVELLQTCTEQGHSDSVKLMAASVKVKYYDCENVRDIYIIEEEEKEEMEDSSYEPKKYKEEPVLNVYNLRGKKR